MQRVNYFSTKAAMMLMLLMTIIFQSCKKESAAVLSTVEKVDIPLLRQAVANSTGMPLDKVEYQENEQNFLVDGDGCVSLEDAKARFAGKNAEHPGDVNAATQKRGYYLITRTKVNAVKIYAEPTVPVAWLRALDEAIMIWNASGSRVYIRRITTTLGATTRVSTIYSVSGTIALSAYPDIIGNPGTKVRINTYQNALVYSKKVFALTHELGHILGFSHTDGTYGYLVTGTPTRDPYSVMNAVCQYWKAFTTYDLKAIRTVYPR